PPHSAQPQGWADPQSNRSCCGGCFCFPLAPATLLAFTFILYFLFPGRTNILIMGLDVREQDSYVGRTDTLILSTVEPWQPYTGMLSIPRDLWVTIPSVGENRVNTAHFFAETEQPGSGPNAAMLTVSSNFGVDVDYYVRIRFIGLLEVVDALGGITVDLPDEITGAISGDQQLDAEDALALVRDRAGSDDFFRMQRGQIFLKALLKNMLAPGNWLQLPQVLEALSESVDTDIPIWLWPRLGLAVFRYGVENIDSRVITRQMTIPFTTEGGAQVLAPNWDEINPVILEIFDQ
ncbi:MAG: LCP family protein, partial [Chloroflexi bacterium]|nr:LCP family protein [Chloroflexota bacterium]